jgi:hypothetical protein
MKSTRSVHARTKLYDSKKKASKNSRMYSSRGCSTPRSEKKDIRKTNKSKKRLEYALADITAKFESSLSTVPVGGGGNPGLPSCMKNKLEKKSMINELKHLSSKLIEKEEKILEFKEKVHKERKKYNKQKLMLANEERSKLDEINFLSR